MEKRSQKRKHRSKAIRPNLDFRYTIQSRHEFLDSNKYINGVRNSDGEMVIRPLNNEELDWLDKFFAGDLNASFSEYNSDMFELSEEEVTVCDNIQKELAKVRNRLAKHRKLDVEEVRELHTRKRELQDLYYSINKKADAYQRNNKRNQDLYGKLRCMGKLDSLEDVSNED